MHCMRGHCRAEASREERRGPRHRPRRIAQTCGVGLMPTDVTGALGVGKKLTGLPRRARSPEAPNIIMLLGSRGSHVPFKKVNTSSVFCNLNHNAS